LTFRRGWPTHWIHIEKQQIPSVVAYSLVPITSTNSEPLTYEAEEFNLLGNNGSGSSGIGEPRLSWAWQQR
jgi:hypothetical protein